MKAIETWKLLLATGVVFSLSFATAYAHDDEHEHAHTATAQQQQPPQGRNSGRPGMGQAPPAMEKVDLPKPEVSITIEGNMRVIRANGLPAHKTGDFPNKDNPNALRPQHHEVRMPIVPTLNDEPIVARPEFGIALNGVIFDAGTAEFWTPDNARAFGGGSEWNYEALGGGVPLGLDMNHAHVQPTGKYHYHGVPTGLVDSLKGDDDNKRMMQLGWAYDGFPIYGPLGYSDAADAKSELKTLRSSYRLKKGQRPASPEGPGGTYDGTFGNDWEYVKGAGDLDECNGRFGVTPEYPQGTYYYVITEDFPAIPRFWRGTPDPSIEQRRPGSGPGPGNGPRPRPGMGRNAGDRRQPPPPPGRQPGQPSRPGQRPG